MKGNPDCILCKLHKTAPYVCVLGDGLVPSDIMIIGEAPGKRDNDSPRAFVNESGKVLEKSLAAVSLYRDGLYIGNAVACQPPGNRTPSKGEIKACRHWLNYQLSRVKPKYILLLGGVALESALSLKGIRKLRGRPIEKDGIIYLPTYHPAYILRDPSHQSTFDRDIAFFKEIIDFGGIPQSRDLDYIIVDNEDKFEDMLDDLSGSVSCDLETTGLYPWAADARIVSIGFGTTNHQWIIPAETASIWPKIKLASMVREIDDKLEDCYLIGHNFKFDSLWMRVRFGVKWYADFDTMLAHYLLDENDRHGLKDIAQKFLSAPDWEVDVEQKKVWSDKLALYHAHDLHYTRQLRFYLGNQLEKDPAVKRVFEKLLMPCSRLFSDIEYHGVYINLDKMEEAEEYLHGEVAKAEKELKKYGNINWGSPQQVADLFFNKLKIPVLDRTPTGNPSTSESVIKRIEHPAAEALLRLRGARQQLSFFIDGWKPFIINSRLHPSFKLHGAVTGRLSSEHPNLQQVPRDTRIRSLISAPLGWTFVQVDLSQVELRIAAELANEPTMMHAFKNNIDLHWLTAIREVARGAGLKNEVIGTVEKHLGKKLPYTESIEELIKMGPDIAVSHYPGWKEYRKKAKAINFGLLYGMWWRKLKDYARDNYGIVLNDKQAKEARSFFFATYRLEEWHRSQKSFVRAYGYVRSLTGRKRRLPQALNQFDTPEKKEAERQSINSPVQSFASDINLMIALQTREEFTEDVLHIVGTVHDAILMEVRNDAVEKVVSRVLAIARKPKLFETFNIKLSVPIEMEADIGDWGLGIKFEKWLLRSKNP